MTPRRSVRTPLAVAAAAALVAAGGFALSGTDAEPDAPRGVTTSDAAPRTAAPSEVSPGEETQQQSRFPSGPEDNVAAELERRDPGDPMAQGDPDAPVVMLIYSDFQCPFCRSWAVETKPALQPYIDDGTLRLEWRDFPYLGPESTLAALAGRAAAEQDRFWEFHDAVYAQDFAPNSGAVDEESLRAWAADAGLDVDLFGAEINTAGRQEEVFTDRDEGVQVGVTGTPAFLVNGVPVIGAQPTETFIGAVEAAAAARNG